jgi:CHAD domain-containing protein
MDANINIGYNLTRIKNLLGKFKREQKKGDIHGLRIEIKKLRTLSYFLSQCNPGMHLPAKALKKLFNEAGHLREFQVDLKFLKEIQGTPNKKKKLHHLIKQEEKKLIRKIPDYLLDIRHFEKTKQLKFFLPDRKKIEKFFALEVRKAEKLVVMPLKKNLLHEFRKELKKILYVYDILPAPLKNDIALDRKRLHTLQDEIGKWHDLRRAKAFYKKIKLSGKQMKEIRKNEKKQFILVRRHATEFMPKNVASSL